MLTARLCVRRLVALVLVAGSLLPACPPRAVACPVAPPSPLRELYKESALVVTARVGDSVVLKRLDENGGAAMKTTLEVLETHKGESISKAIDVYYYAWGPRLEYPAVFIKGAKVLAFLRPREEGGGYEVYDLRYGVKQLPDEDLKVYVARIAELAKIMEREKPDPQEIAEWLVRCAEEPATRWEGAYELGLNVEVPQAEPEQDANDASATEEEAAATPEEESPPAEDGAAPSADNADEQQQATKEPPTEAEPDYTKLLKPEQKERLANALFNADKISEGEVLLIELIGQWQDARLVPFLLKHLQRLTDNPPYEVETMLAVLAHVIGDQSLIKLAATYSRDADYEDLYERDYDEANEREVKAAKEDAVRQRADRLRTFITLALAAQLKSP